MARYTEDKRDDIDSAVDRWKERCLIGDGSLVFDDREDVWTLEHADDLYARFNQNPFEGKEGGGTFFTKWARQLEGASESLRLHAAEVLLVHFLFASSVTYAGKLKTIEACLRDIDLTLPKALEERLAAIYTKSNTNMAERTGIDLKAYGYRLD